VAEDRLMLDTVPVPAQDDARETQMRQLFNLSKEGGRHDIDATLTLNGRSVPQHLRGTVVQFELKSSTKGRPDISTVRDFGLHYIEKWSKLHWLFGVYSDDRTLEYCLYGSPKRMSPWFERMASYIAPDVALGEVTPSLITDDTLTSVMGSAEVFSRDDAKRLMKNSYTTAQYAQAADVEGGRYSRQAMVAMLRRRAEYVIRRGSTLNNPHMPASYFQGWERIIGDHSARLRELVVDALQGK